MKSVWGRSMLVGWSTMLGIWGGMGCLFKGEASCQLSTDCPDGMFCQMASCVELGMGSASRHEGSTPEDDEVVLDGERGERESDEDIKEDSEEVRPCPSALQASERSLVVNEILANVPTGEAGDANQDGVREAYDDEFVELVNISNEVLDLTGVEVRNASTTKFVFPPYCLLPAQAAVVFGGVAPAAEVSAGVGWEAFVADRRFSFANGAGRVVVVDAEGQVIADVRYGSHPGQSLNLNIDLNGADYVPHRDVNEARILSPGTCADGRSFSTRCVQD